MIMPIHCSLRSKFKICNIKQFQKIRIYFKNNNIVDKKTSYSKSKRNTKDERKSWLWNEIRTSSIALDKNSVNKYNGYICNTDTENLYFPTISNNQKIMEQFIKNDYNEFYNNVTSAESFITKISLEYTTQKINTAQITTFPSPFEQVILPIISFFTYHPYFELPKNSLVFKFRINK